MKQESSQTGIELKTEEKHHQKTQIATVITILLILTFIGSTIYVGISCFFAR